MYPTATIKNKVILDFITVLSVAIFKKYHNNESNRKYRKVKV